MTVTAIKEDTQTISNTEYSLINSSTSVATSTTAGAYQLFVDTNAIALGDQYEIYLREKVASGGTQRQLSLGVLSGPQTNPFVTGTFMLLNGWDFTMKRLAGSDRSFSWSIRKAG